MTGTQVQPLMRRQLTILLAMYLGYAALMVCRNTLIVSSAAMVEDPNLDLDKESFGHLMSWHSAGAIAGKLITGPGADLLGGRRMFLLALVLTGAANVGFAFCTSFAAFAFFNFAGQFAKAGGWPAMTKLVSAWYPPSSYGRVWSIISTSSRVGTIAAGLVLGWMLYTMPWQSVFIASAIFTAVIAAWLLFVLKDRPDEPAVAQERRDHRLTLETKEESFRKEPIQQDLREDPKHPLSGKSLQQACVRFLGSARCWAICAGIVFLTIVMDFLTFIPIYLSESLGLDPSQASMAGTSFPVGMFVALLVSSVLYDRFSKRQLAFCLAGMLLLSVLCVVGLWQMDLLPSHLRSFASMLLLFTLGFTISPAYYVPMSVFAVAFGGRHSGFLVSVIDIFGYAGALVFNFYGGSIAQEYGWDVFLCGLMGVCVCAVVSMGSFFYLDYRSDRRSDVGMPGAV